MVQERQRNTTFMPETNGYTTVEFELPPVELALIRPVSCTPFVPQDAATRAERCELILRIQAEGLAKRMEHTHASAGVLGISAGWTAAWPCWWPCAPVRCWAATRRILWP